MVALVVVLSLVRYSVLNLKKINMYSNISLDESARDDKKKTSIFMEILTKPFQYFKMQNKNAIQENLQLKEVTKKSNSVEKGT